MLIRWSLPLAITALMAVPASAADESITAGPGFTFSPAEVTIDLGNTVTWNSDDFLPHNVKFDDGSFEQPPNPSAGPWQAQRTFNTPGTFRFYCEQHGGPNGAGMSGTVFVRDATGQVPEPVEVPPGLTARTRDELGLGRLESRGVRVRTRCVNGCEVTLKLSLAPRTAERFGFADRRKTIGTERATLPMDQTVPLDVELTQKAANRLADAKRPFKVRLDVRATKDTSETARKTIKINP